MSASTLTCLCHAITSCRLGYLPSPPVPSLLPATTFTPSCHLPSWPLSCTQTLSPAGPSPSQLAHWLAPVPSTYPLTLSSDVPVHVLTHADMWHAQTSQSVCASVFVWRTL